MTKKGFSFRIDGIEHDERVTIYTDKQHVLFDGYTDLLFSRIEGDLHLDLNFGTSKYLPHRLRMVGDRILLIPNFVYTQDHLDILFRLEPRDYLALPIPKTFVFSADQVSSLFYSLGSWISGELERLSLPNSNDLNLMWLLGSGHSGDHFSYFSIKGYSTTLIENLLTEYPDRTPTVKQTIQMLADNHLVFETSELIPLKGGDIVNVYIAEEKELYIEWKAMLQNGMVCVLSEEFGAKLYKTDPDTS